MVELNYARADEWMYISMYVRTYILVLHRTVCIGVVGTTEYSSYVRLILEAGMHRAGVINHTYVTEFVSRY